MPRFNVMRPDDLFREMNGVNLKLAPPSHITLREPEIDEVTEEEAALKNDDDAFWVRRAQIDLPRQYLNRAFVHRSEVGVYNYNAINFVNSNTCQCLMSILEILYIIELNKHKSVLEILY